MQKISIIIYIISILAIIGIELHFYYRFIKVLASPFNNSKIINELQTVEEIYSAYKKLTKLNFKLVKMRVRSWNKSEIIPLSIDSFMKIIISILLTTTGVVVTILLANLNFANNNKEIDINQRSAWYENIYKILEGLTIGISSYKTLIFIALLLFVLSFVHIGISHLKNSLYKKHLIVLEEIEKEYNSAQKISN